MIGPRFDFNLLQPYYCSSKSSLHCQENLQQPSTSGRIKAASATLARILGKSPSPCSTASDLPYPAFKTDDVQASGQSTVRAGDQPSSCAHASVLPFPSRVRLRSCDEPARPQGRSVPQSSPCKRHHGATVSEDETSLVTQEVSAGGSADACLFSDSPRWQELSDCLVGQIAAKAGPLLSGITPLLGTCRCGCCGAICTESRTPNLPM